MDFIERLNDKINAIPAMPIQSRLGYLDTVESLALYPLPGSTVLQEYMDGVSDQRLNYEIAMKSRSQQKITEVLWKVQKELSNLNSLASSDGSFEFKDITITNMPYINQLDDQGWFVFLLDLQANITVYENEEENVNG